MGWLLGHTKDPLWPARHKKNSKMEKTKEQGKHCNFLCIPQKVICLGSFRDGISEQITNPCSLRCVKNKGLGALSGSFSLRVPNYTQW